MTQQIQDIKIMLEEMYNVPTNIANKTDLTTGKKLTPVQLHKYHEVGGWAGLDRKQVEELLENGFGTEETTEADTTEITPEETTEADTTEITPEEQHRLDYIAGMEQWVMNAPNAIAFEKRNAYMVKWKANNL